MPPTFTTLPVKIGVLADTHDRLPHSVLTQLHDCDQIWHLGDVCLPSTLSPLYALGKPLSIVHGNCDSEESWPMTLTHHMAGKTFHLIHIPPAQAPLGTDILLHGHTHVPCDHTISGCRYLNPGCISRPNRGAPASFATLTVHPNTEILWQLHKFQA